MQNVFVALITLGVAVGLFLAMLVFLELGRRLGVRQARLLGPAARTGVGVVDSAVYAVLALLLGFTFNGATARFDYRRDLIAQEVSTISTAWSRIDALPPEPQPGIRLGLQRYVDALLASYALPAGSPEGERERATAMRWQDKIWSRALAACLAENGEKARMLLLPALNEMFDVVERERLARRMHPPLVIYAMLVLAALAASLFAGYSMANGKTRNWLYIIGVAATISVVTYVIIELEHPRLGVVRVDAFDQALKELRATMN